MKVFDLNEYVQVLRYLFEEISSCKHKEFKGKLSQTVEIHTYQRQEVQQLQIVNQIPHVL